MQLKIELEPVAGTIHAFVVHLAGVVIGRGDGNHLVRVVVPVPATRQELQILVVGIPGSRYQTTIDLPGTANDFKWTSELTATYHNERFMVGG